MPGFVSIVGAGPWDPELLTIGGRERLTRADVVIADYLVNPELLLHCREHAIVKQRIAGPRTGARFDQARVNQFLLEHARAGRYVVRLKGGDPCMFGRGGEEARFLREHGIDYELVAGVSSPIAAAESAGIPVTHRDHTPAVTFVSGYEAYDKAGLHVAWEHLARSAGTIVLMMGVKNVATNLRRLVEAGRAADTPAAAVRWGTRGIQSTIVGTLEDLPDRIEEAGLRPPAIIVVGPVVGLRNQIGWFEQRPLFGRRVVVTRARGRGQQLRTLLARQGADVVSVPCLAVKPPVDVRALDEAVADGTYDGLVLSSAHGVEALHGALGRLNLDVRHLSETTVVAVGAATAEACRARGLRPDLVPDQANSEGLVAALREAGLLPRRLLHVRADEGRQLLGQAVREAGGQYRLAVGYRTVRPPPPATAIRSLLPAEQGGEGMDAVIFTSGKTARHFLQSVGEVLGDDQAAAVLQQAKVIAMGPVTHSTLEQDLNIGVDATATAPNDDDLVDAVRRALSGSLPKTL